MDIRKINNSDLQLFWYVESIFTKTTTKNKALIIIRDCINEAIESIKNKPANLENCRQLKSFLVFKKAEIVSKGLSGADVDEVIESIDNLVTTLDSGIALGEKEELYHSGSSLNHKHYDWITTDNTYDTTTLEGYLKSHHQEFSDPKYSLPVFVESGYFEHCMQKGWGARTTAETFCRLYEKPRFRGDTKYTQAI